MNILHIDCSPRMQSHSRSLSSAIVDRLLTGDRDGSVTRRDLGRNPIPHADAHYATTLASTAAHAAGSQGDAMRLSEQLIQELEAAGSVVIGTPMNNFTVPSVLKAWIDRILRVRRTFVSTPNGKVGLLRDRPVFVAIASGGFFSGDAANQPDFLTPYLTAALGCVGLKTLHFLPLQGTASRDQQAVATARSTLLATLETLETHTIGAE
ncbi:FMN-dependent NADH-azoreductase [Paraburkholderia rhizosphaerae]|uniref:FMN dependent NADH:quinone oxidoreductase n=1 Tax=Paraburkholderia rhizosphaerae TaxID=480658 RepID=A0A4R8L6D8_9BURK|nr:NAD(P)H-dependent oxidoreductase [Paraburkholderia rhizosphaerae]TDY38227.1 FMN-dependent NADH-azoreductase [Paraburkholderia rhizosphaerae]